MKIAVAQINPLVGDLSGNTAKITENIRKAGANRADLVIFPELAITGYPPRDLLMYESFIKRAREIITREILPGTGGISVLLGTPWREEENGCLFNAALLLGDGKIQSYHYKTLLPDYDIFEESRYFAPAKERILARIKGKKAAITICEDIWNDKDLFARRRYSADPVEELFNNGAQILINMSASPYHLGKAEKRAHMLRALARKYHSSVIYVSQVGGNDELIFDGGSMICSGAGEIIYRAEPFREELVFIDMKTAAPGADSLFPEEDISWVFSALSLGLRDYFSKSGLKKAVLGLSGGIDSAVVAAIAADSLGPENVLGVMMPSRYSTVYSVKDSEELAGNLGIETRLIPIEEPFKKMIEIFNEESEALVDLAEENLQARLRGNILMFISNREGRVVLSGGNKSELAVGYCTLYGDMCGGIAVLSDVPKMMVYRLAAYINQKAGKDIIPASIIEKPPSAELRPNQRDSDSLPGYEILDKILHLYMVENKHIDEITALGYEYGLVRDIVKKVDRSEYKRLQAAPGLRVTSRAFGSGWRMPMAKKFTDLYGAGNGQDTGESR